MKRKIIILLLLILSLILTSCVKIDTSSNKPKEKYMRDGIKMSKEEAEKFDKEIRENLNYYEDIYTAIENNRLGNEMGRDLKLKEVLKTIENDEKIIIYGILEHPAGYENFAVIPLLKKNEVESDKILYSEPLEKNEVNYEECERDTIDIERYRPVFFQRLNYFGRDDTIIPEKKNFQFYLLLDREESEKIKVNGIKPDEIIEYEINDQELKRHKAYFVYFNDIPMDGTFDDMDITFD
ncbi:MAG TPA: hypothetical protein VK071_10785 [Tissierellales bacterium]|nr:hypothetical protein [Tissierellales bacterium]